MPTKKYPHRGRPLLRGADNQRDRLSVRVDPSLRDDLMREAHCKRRTLSREVEERLRASLQKPDRKLERKAFGEGRNRALAFLIARLAEIVDCDVAGTMPGRGPGSWRTDRYAWEALRHGIDILLDRYAPRGTVRVPERIRQNIQKRRQLYERAGKLDEMPEYVRQYEKPEGLANAIANGLIHQIEHAQALPANLPKNQIYAEGFYQFPAVKEALETKGVKS